MPGVSSPPTAEALTGCLMKGGCWMCDLPNEQHYEPLCMLLVRLENTGVAQNPCRE